MFFSVMRGAKLRFVFSLIALAFLSGALLRPLNGGEDLFNPEFRTAGKETVSVQVIGALIYLISIGMLLWQWARLRFNKEIVLIFVIVAVALCSAYWANDPSVSIRRSAALAGTTIFGIALAISLDRKQIMFVLNSFTLLFFAVTIVLAVIFREFSFHQVGGFAGFAGALRGPFNHKNDMGHVVGLLLVILAISGKSSMSKFVWAVSVAAGSVLLIATLSAGSLVAVIAGFGGTYVVAKIALTPSSQLRMLVWLTLLLSGAVLAFFWDDFLALVLDSLGKDSTLSDRTLIWNLVILSGKDNWILGSGYGVAWLGAAADTVKSGLYASINNAHNGFLEIWLQIGAVGVALVVLLLMFAAIKLNVNFRRNDPTFGRASLAILIYVIVENIATVHLLSYNDMTWSLIVAVAYLANSGIAYKSSQERYGRVPQLHLQRGGEELARSPARRVI